MRITSEVGAQRLYLIRGEASAAELRAAVASLLQFSWEQGGSSDPDSWRLYAGRDRLALPERLRRQAIARGREQLLARLAALRDAMQEKPGGREALEKRFPEDARLLGGRWTAAAARVLSLLSDNDVADLARREVWVSPRLTDRQPLTELTYQVLNGLPPPYADAVGPNGERKRTRIFTIDRPGNDYHFVLDLDGTPDAPGIRGGPVDLVPASPPPTPPGVSGPIIPDYLRANVAYLPPPVPLTGGPSERSDPRLQQTVRLAKSDERGGLRYADILQRIAAETGLSIASDCFASTDVRRLDAQAVRQPLRLAEALDRVAAAFHYRWRLEEKFLLLRHARWYFEEQAEVPDAVLHGISDAVTAQGGLSTNDICRLASSLTPPQFASLRYYLADLWLIYPLQRSYLLFGSLTPQQREAALSRGGLAFAALSPTQQEAFLEVTRGERPYWMLEPPERRSRWVLAQRPTKTPDVPWLLIYAWGAGDFDACGLRRLLKVDLTREPEPTPEHPEAEKTL